MAKPTIHRIAGRLWSVYFCPKKKACTLGECDYNERRITVHGTHEPKMELDILVHEVLHACSDVLSEDFVDPAATDIANLLWDLGYRRTE